MVDRLRTWVGAAALGWAGVAVCDFLLGYHESATVFAFFSVGAFAVFGVLSAAVRNG